MKGAKVKVYKYGIVKQGTSDKDPQIQRNQYQMEVIASTKEGKVFDYNATFVSYDLACGNALVKKEDGFLELVDVSLIQMVEEDDQ